MAATGIATRPMILVAYRHGLRASEVCDLQWQQIELSEGRLHGHCASYAAITPQTLTYMFSSAAGQSVPSVSTGLSSASVRLPRCHSRSTRTCFAMPAGSGHDTRALQHYLGHKNIQHTVRYTEMAPDRFKDFWRD